ncbi:hypothetical protein SDC9_187328 [bioreactor metagenome]|uniref:Uncharacterized protein n=1 Tax=bioreactor metagenome TaxID=1076179 RepID=A0A645HMK6_9ZZZZ
MQVIGDRVLFIALMVFGRKINVETDIAAVDLAVKYLVRDIPGRVFRAVDEIHTGAPCFMVYDLPAVHDDILS